ncbi:MAG: phosphocholine cytidylyltransferase family protein [Dehalococcoidales bacterium]|nr:phosphocholine cytidylyltransferase family protein [Dehalococcoidales bacterium]
MRAVITAAARSPRLLPITKNTPVSLLEVGGKAILDHQLQALQKAGLKDILVITGFGAEQIEKFCAGRVSCIFNPFYETCNVAMNLWLVRHELKSGFILQYNDTLFQSELISEVIAEEGDILLVVDRKGIDKEAERVVIQQDLVIAIGKDVDEPYGEFIGIAKFSSEIIPAVIEELEQVARTNLDTSFPRLIRRLIGKGHPVSVYTTDHPWIDIDFPSDLEEANRRWHR